MPKGSGRPPTRSRRTQSNTYEQTSSAWRNRRREEDKVRVQGRSLTQALKPQIESGKKLASAAATGIAGAAKDAGTAAVEKGKSVARNLRIGNRSKASRVDKKAARTRDYPGSQKYSRGGTRRPSDPIATASRPKRKGASGSDPMTLPAPTRKRASAPPSATSSSSSRAAVNMKTKGSAPAVARKSRSSKSVKGETGFVKTGSGMYLRGGDRQRVRTGDTKRGKWDIDSR